MCLNLKPAHLKEPRTPRYKHTDIIREGYNLKFIATSQSLSVTAQHVTHIKRFFSVISPSIPDV